MNFDFNETCPYNTLHAQTRPYYILKMPAIDIYTNLILIWRFIEGKNTPLLYLTMESLKSAMWVSDGKDGFSFHSKVFRMNNEY